MSTFLLALFAQFPTVIGSMGKSFDSHDFIMRLFSQNQKEYAQALVSCGHLDPVREVNRLIALHLKKYPYLVQRDGNTLSPNLFGRSTKCARWKRR